MGKIDVNVLKAIFDERYDSAFVQKLTRKNKEYWNGYCAGINWGRNTIAEATTVESVEVTKCNNCKMWVSYPDGNGDYGRCRKFGITMRLDDFCSYGEREN